jgi:uncharacterized coiled-coil DUF342 family protein
MPLTPTDDIHALRDEVNAKIEATNDLIREPTASSAEVRSLRAVARELVDFEIMLSDAVFLKNTSEIAKLTGEIQEATQAGVKTLEFLKDIRQAVAQLRQAVQGATAFATRVQTLADEVDELTKSLQPPPGS